MLVVLKGGGHPLQHPAALDEHVPRGVHQDVADLRIVQQRLQRAEPEHVVEHFDEQRFALAEAEGGFSSASSCRAGRGSRFRPGAVSLRERLEVQTVEQSECTLTRS